MASRTRRVPSPAAAPLRRPPRPLIPTSPAAVVAELRELHVAAGDPAVERMPEDEQPREALLYAEQHARALSGPAAGRAAVLRVRLWEHLRRESDREFDVRQSRAVQDARDAGVRWEDLAEPLGLAKGSASAAQSKARRMRAPALAAKPGVGPVRRTPEAVTRVEEELAATERVERLREVREVRRGAATVAMGRRLLEVRTVLVVDEEGEADYWMDQIAAVVADCRTSRQIASLGTYLSAALRYLRRVEQSAPNARVLLEEIKAWERKDGDAAPPRPRAPAPGSHPGARGGPQLRSTPRSGPHTPISLPVTGQRGTPGGQLSRERPSPPTLNGREAPLRGGPPWEAVPIHSASRGACGGPARHLRDPAGQGDAGSL